MMTPPLATLDVREVLARPKSSERQPHESLTTTSMQLQMTGLISKITEYGAEVQIDADSNRWREIVQLAMTSFAAVLRLEEHGPGVCSCDPKLASLLQPSFGHYAIIGTLPVNPTEVEATAEAYERFLTRQLAILEIQSLRPTKKEE